MDSIIVIYVPVPLAAIGREQIMFVRIKYIILDLDFNSGDIFPSLEIYLSQVNV